MSNTIIQVENLSKKYIIAHQQQEKYTTLRDSLASSSKLLLKKIHNPKFKAHNSQKEDFWALKDVSFEIKQGDRVGIIGRNGAGKSTLLKILSRITEPTSGRISINGRVASLLEVGTGFHPELTGRENIYLNGAILGMSKAEIKRKFDEIVDFAEVEKFLDTPVKHYSSGMYVRLAFAVAAHLEPEILIVDEVLAVGDIQFQKKCLGKMDEVGKSGRTVLFVSHNMSTIQTLCPRCIFLKKGQVTADDSTNSVTKLYIQGVAGADHFFRTKQKNGKPTITSGKILRQPEDEDEKIQITLEIFSESQQKLALELRLYDVLASPVGFGDLGRVRPSQLITLKPGINTIVFQFPIYQLAMGSYSISLDLTLPKIEYLDRVESCLSFDVSPTPLKDKHSVVSQELGVGSVEFPLVVVQPSFLSENLLHFN